MRITEGPHFFCSFMPIKIFQKKKKKITPIKKTIMPSLFKKKKEKEKEKGKQITNLKTEILSFIYIYF